jgi:hypothetical protein
VDAAGNAGSADGGGDDVDDDAGSGDDAIAGDKNDAEVAAVAEFAGVLRPPKPPNIPPTPPRASPMAPPTPPMAPSSIERLGVTGAAAGSTVGEERGDVIPNPAKMEPTPPKSTAAASGAAWAEDDPSSESLVGVSGLIEPLIEPFDSARELPVAATSRGAATTTAAGEGLALSGGEGRRTGDSDPPSASDELEESVAVPVVRKSATPPPPTTLATAAPAVTVPARGLRGRACPTSERAAGSLPSAAVGPRTDA